MAKAKSQKELHPLYQSWYHARRTGILSKLWKEDFWTFISQVGIRPDNCRLKRKDTTKELSIDNFIWVEVKLRIKDFKDNAAYMRQYRKNNPEYYKNKDLKKSFGITLDDYNLMLVKQNNVCAICNKPETMFDSKQKVIRKLSVDHCHSTGKIRGLLCSHCNHALGKFQDNIDYLQKAIDYLKGYSLT